MKLIIELPDKEWEEWENGLRIIHTKPLTEALEKAKPLQAELEEIKTEVEDFKEKCTACEYLGCGIVEILDNHINKADCNNDCEHCEWVECPKE